MESASPANPPHPSRAGILLAYAVIYVVWGSTYLAIRVGVETLPPLLMAGTRFAIAGAILYAWRRLRGDARPAPGAWRSALLIGALMLFAGNGLVSWAVQRGVDSGTAALLVVTTPLWVALVDWARPGGVRPTVGGWIGLLLGFIGAAMLVGPKALAGGAAHEARASHAFWALAVVLAAFSWAIGVVIIARRKHATSPALASAMQMLCGGTMLLIAGAAKGEASVRWADLSTSSLVALAYLIVFGSLMAFSTYVWLLKVEPPARVATNTYVNPVVAVLLGWWLLNERLTAMTFVAATIIVAGVAMITVSRQVRRDGVKTWNVEREVVKT